MTSVRIVNAALQTVADLSRTTDQDTTHLYLRGEVLAYAGRLNETHAMAAERYEEAVIDRSPEAQAWFARLLAKTVDERNTVADNHVSVRSRGGTTRP